MDLCPSLEPPHFREAKRRGACRACIITCAEPFESQLEVLLPVRDRITRPSKRDNPRGFASYHHMPGHFTV